MTHRTPEQLKHHYDVERRLADKLKKADKEERTSLYSDVYDELFLKVSDHPQVLERENPQIEAKRVAGQLRFLKPFLKPSTVYAEIGPGVCSLAKRVSKLVAQVHAVDVSDEIVDKSNLPDNFHFAISDGTSVPIETSTVDLAFSNQLMEHLHQDDALEQLKSVYSCLKPGGLYICITPSRLSGPHDVSQHFSPVAQGLHLKEYTYKELHGVFRAVGFTRFSTFVGYRGIGFRAPLGLVLAIENMVSATGPNLRRKIARILPLRLVLGIKMLAWK